MEMKNAFDGLINKLDVAEERTSETEDISKESSKTKKQREQRWKKREQDIQGPWGNYKRCNICVMGTPEGEEIKEQKKYLKQCLRISPN